MTESAFRHGALPLSDLMFERNAQSVNPPAVAAYTPIGPAYRKRRFLSGAASRRPKDLKSWAQRHFQRSLRRFQLRLVR
jgi:hypothetical protein